MDVFTKFNRKSIGDRQVDTLIGLSKGLVADGRVDQAEAETLLTWLIQSRQCSENPIIIDLLDKVGAYLEDGVLDEDESRDLLATLRSVSGEESEIGELAKPTNLPIDEPLPDVVFENKKFLFTGTFAYGTRKQCKEALESLRGVCAPGVSKSLNYLVLGSYVTDSWIHENFGRKIEKAMAYRDQGVPIVIVPEYHWIECGGLS